MDLYNINLHFQSYSYNSRLHYDRYEPLDIGYKIVVLVSMNCPVDAMLSIPLKKNDCRNPPTFEMMMFRGQEVKGYEWEKDKQETFFKWLTKLSKGHRPIITYNLHWHYSLMEKHSLHFSRRTPLLVNIRYLVGGY